MTSNRSNNNMEAADIIHVLQERVATIPGGRDLDGRPLVVVVVQPWTNDYLDTALKYYSSIYSPETRQTGFCVLLDAQRSTWKTTKSVMHKVLDVLDVNIGAMIVVRLDVFWDKQRVDNCTKTRTEGEPIFVSLSRIHKYVSQDQLPVDLGGSWVYNHEQWIHNRIRVEEFIRSSENAVSDMEKLRQHLTNNQSLLKQNTADVVLTVSSEKFKLVSEYVKKVSQSGQTICHQINKTYSDQEQLFPQDILDTKEILNHYLRIVHDKMMVIVDCWNGVQKKFDSIKEFYYVEQGIKRVINWILGPGEEMMNSKHQVGYDIVSAEEYRRNHEGLELQCRDTYGHYAELLHKINKLSNSKSENYKDLIAQRDFMDFVCRSFANRLERRRNLLITSARFFRLVAEYFQTTSDVYETLVMGTDIEALESPENTLMQLKLQQDNIEFIERNLIKEGEKLSDMLSMPVKNAMGVVLNIDYEADIVNVSEILEMTKARCQLFCDSVELQRLTLQQVSHVLNYEADASQAIQWLDDLYQVLLKLHCHIGSNADEIQIQKKEHQSFQEIAKNTYDYGCQLLNAALSLRQSCKLTEYRNAMLANSLWQSWKLLDDVSQEQLTRLRVSAVYHRNVDKYSIQLRELMETVHTIQDESNRKINNHKGRLRKCLVLREKILLEVGRTVRLGRMLKTRLREPPSILHMSEEEQYLNDSAVESISKKLGMVTELAEQLDFTLSGLAQSTANNFLIDSTGNTTQEWYINLSKMDEKNSISSKSEENNNSSRSDGEDFVTASEYTGSPPSRSSSYHTPSEGETTSNSPWWELETTNSTIETITIKKESQQASDILTDDQLNNDNINKSLENSIGPEKTKGISVPKESKDNVANTIVVHNVEYAPETNNNDCKFYKRNLAKQALAGVF
ncbi:SEC14 domain and spectrin repeat-containing protein 1-B [Daktulosphaira vitifoliae]|uniref:SEC14 domain and spectrin repeat-containing protein 1-B n=1 Tax=Daktulosphaira vitifoliae TaxID=58002 RepID=UPI0021AA488B|nr:SEC14 domain and spectrin repeat-containing protein 1-B [Daktulosphaira vitifoliae]